MVKEDSGSKVTIPVIGNKGANYRKAPVSATIIDICGGYACLYVRVSVSLWVCGSVRVYEYSTTVM